MVHTSVLTRAIRTADLALDEAGRSWLPVRRHWRLNERHYGALQGLQQEGDGRAVRGRAVHGSGAAATTPRRRRSQPDDRARPGAATPATATSPADVLPATECLADVVRRALPYWEDAIVPDLLAAGHGAVPCWSWPTATASGRCASTSTASRDDDIVGLEIPTGIP